MTSTKYIGMDVHKESISIQVMNSVGKAVMECVIETKASTILQFIDGLRGDLRVTFEEGTWAACERGKSIDEHVVSGLGDSGGSRAGGSWDVYGVRSEPAGDRPNIIVLKTSTSIFFLVIPPRLRFRLHTNWFRVADCQLLMPSSPSRTESYQPEPKRHRTIVNTVSLLRLVPVRSGGRQLGRTHVRHECPVLRARHVDDYNLHPMLLGGRSHLAWPTFPTVR
jgi:hypothetical protein